MIGERLRENPHGNWQLQKNKNQKDVAHDLTKASTIKKHHKEAPVVSLATLSTKWPLS